MLFLETDELELELSEAKAEKELADGETTKALKAYDRSENVADKGARVIRNITNRLKRMAADELSEGNIASAVSHVTGTVLGGCSLAMTGQFRACLYFLTIRLSSVGKGLNAFAQRKLFNSYQHQYERIDSKIKELDKENTREAKEQKNNLIDCRASIKSSMSKLERTLPHFNNNRSDEDDE